MLPVVLGAVALVAGTVGATLLVVAWAPWDGASSTPNVPLTAPEAEARAKAWLRTEAKLNEIPLKDGREDPGDLIVTVQTCVARERDEVTNKWIVVCGTNWTLVSPNPPRAPGFRGLEGEDLTVAVDAQTGRVSWLLTRMDGGF